MGLLAIGLGRPFSRCLACVLERDEPWSQRGMYGTGPEYACGFVSAPLLGLPLLAMTHLVNASALMSACLTSHDWAIVSMCICDLGFVYRDD